MKTMRIHFIAIGGAAMHNLAMAVASKTGYVVTGSDDEIFDPARTHLQEAGLLPKETGWHPEMITPNIDAIILGMHAREDNPELVRARELGIKIYSFPEYLYEQTKDKIRIVVGGSHGKTTTTSMILYVLQHLGIETDYMVGAQIEGFERMVRLSDTAKYAVFEGDEYLTSPLDLRSKFLWYHPHIAILTGIAWDHINVFPTFPQYVETFRKFVDTIEPGGTFIYYQNDNNLQAIAAAYPCRSSGGTICRTCRRHAWRANGSAYRRTISTVSSARLRGQVIVWRRSAKRRTLWRTRISPTRPANCGQQSMPCGSVIPTRN